MSHFYRGEMGRIMVWRQRLDVTTNWAITSSTAIITIAFTTREVPHIIFFFNLAIVWVLLWIEARRYRFYDAFRARVRMLEAHFLVPMVMENRQMLQGEWKKLVCEDLILPCFKISKLEAVGRRLKRNYVFIFVLILVAWLTKIFLHARLTISSRFTMPCGSGTSRRGWWRWSLPALSPASFQLQFTSANDPPAKSQSSAHTARCGGSDRMSFRAKSRNLVLKLKGDATGFFDSATLRSE